MRLYNELADWYPLLTAPPEYAEEAAHIAATIDAVCQGPAITLLELGAGAGANASHLKSRFRCTLSDISPRMLDISRALNPDCEHVEADMRQLRLGLQFDAVLVHDAIGYMRSQADLRAAMATAALHVRPGGAALFIPDDIADTFAPRTEEGGTDGPDGRSLRYLIWTRDADPADGLFETHFAMLIAEPGRPVRCEHDVHIGGLFARATWLRLLDEAGFDRVETGIADPYEGEHTVFAARRRSL